ncbi:hypothetical protein [Rhodococcus sp. NJ-530]|uniref:hypothetical protein n=1 Tax=Rhodococcus sp. NJ-530 TaxID=2490853 RepID=UPI000F6250A6|nr:hypothetical protein [Rhodococcus sp. NJ-530]AZI65444.1 hypothetical protein EHW12_30440 [Rhodococcus sp. NJ-530]
MSQDAELDGRLAVVLPDGFNPARDDKRIPVRRIYGMYNPARDSIRASVDQLLGRSPEPVSQDEMHRPSMEKDHASVVAPVLESAIAPNPNWDYDGDERVYKWMLNHRDGVFVASDEAGNELQDSAGKRIFVDDLGRRVLDPDADTAVDSAATGENTDKAPRRSAGSVGAPRCYLETKGKQTKYRICMTNTEFSSSTSILPKSASPVSSVVDTVAGKLWRSAAQPSRSLQLSV